MASTVFHGHLSCIRPYQSWDLPQLCSLEDLKLECTCITKITTRMLHKQIYSQDSEALLWTKKKSHTMLLLTSPLSCILAPVYRAPLGHHHVPSACLFTPAIAVATSNQRSKLLTAPSSAAVLIHGQSWKCKRVKHSMENFDQREMNTPFFDSLR